MPYDNFGLLFLNSSAYAEKLVTEKSDAAFQNLEMHLSDFLACDFFRIHKVGEL